MSLPLTGIIAATLTPYDRRGRVDPGMVREHVAYLIEHGVAALAPAGTTGEFLYLDEREKLDLVSATVQAASGRARVVAGIWALDPEGVGRLARGAESPG